jgi:signal transduction histidine kinase
MQTPKILFVICKVIGFGLLFASWIETGEATGFFPIMVLGIMTTLRYRGAKLWYTIIIDGIILLFLGQYLIIGVYVVSEIFYRAWEDERARGLKLRDIEANRYYELEQLKGDLLTATAQVERMTAVSERARIARDIHDNAGHEIVAAYISLQAARTMLKSENTDTLELYDAALERLNSGANKIREAVHNLSTVNPISVEGLREKCCNFPVCQVAFNVYGDTTRVPIYVWIMLESCLSEGLTNITRHSAAKQVTVDLVATPYIIRLCIENDGISKSVNAMGIGLRNLQHRAAAIGGSLSVDVGENFRMICVIPIQES